MSLTKCYRWINGLVTKHSQHDFSDSVAETIGLNIRVFSCRLLGAHKCLSFVDIL